MSGQLVGEVFAAQPYLQAEGLPERAFHALLAIAEKAHRDTREGSVRWDHIRAALYGKSLPTAKRAIADLKSAGLIVLTRRGFNNQAGRSAAPCYRITERITQMSQSPTERTDHPDEPIATTRTDHPDEPIAPSERIKSGGRTDQNRERTDHPDELLDGSLDGSSDELPREGPRFNRNPGDCQRCKKPLGEGWCRNCSGHRDAVKADRAAAGAARAAAIRTCLECNEYGELLGADGLPVTPIVQHHNPRPQAKTA